MKTIKNLVKRAGNAVSNCAYSAIAAAIVSGSVFGVVMNYLNTGQFC